MTLRVDPVPDRAVRLAELARLVRSGVSAERWEALVDALAADSRASAERVARGAGVELRRAFWTFPGLQVDGDPESLAGLGRVATSPPRGAHIRVATNAQNHAADVVQAMSGFDGRGVALALLDSGIDVDCAGSGAPHPAFEHRPRTNASRIAGAFGISNPAEFDDPTGHGTGVAGIALAIDWMSTGAPSDDGFAPAATVVSYKVTTGTWDNYLDADLLAGVERVLRDAIRFRIKVANFSYAGDPSPTWPTQQALDRLATIGDILVVTSAGNDGTLPNPTFRSCGNVNGLATAAVHANTHVYWTGSTPGPLLGDSSRLWPDIAAVGVGLITPAPDSPHGTSLPRVGTSFAAPAVAGTALVLRAARPDLDATDTKVLILNSVADISASNPGLNHFHYGLGLLRTDLAVRALLEGQLHRGVLNRTAPQTDVPIAVVAGTVYAATLGWMRNDLTSNRWDDLDLEVLDAQGAVFARSTTPQNVYERVVFRARETATWRLRVRGSSLVQDLVPWSLAFGVEHGGGRQAGEYASFAAGCAGSGADPLGVPVPALTGAVWGTSRTDLLTGVPGRVLGAFEANEIPAGYRIDRLAFRRDESHWGSRSFTIDLEILAGHTQRSVPNLSSTFASNPDGGGLVRVLRSTSLDWPGTSGLPDTPADFDCIVPLDQPFVAAGLGSGRHLLLDFKVHGHSNGSAPFGLWLDLDTDPFRYGLVYQRGDPNAVAGAVAPWSLVVSLISGESGGIAPRLIADRTPQLGERFDVVLRHAPAGAIAALVHGESRDSWGGGIGLPWSLAGAGAPRCALLVSPDALLPARVDAGGQARVEYLLPLDPALTSVEFFNQFLIVDPAANPLGLTVSNGGIGRIGG